MSGSDDYDDDDSYSTEKVSVRPAKAGDVDPNGEYVAFAYGQSGDVDDPVTLAPLPVFAASDRGVLMTLEGEGKGRVSFGPYSRRSETEAWFDVLLPRSGHLEMTSFREGKGGTITGFKLLEPTLPDSQTEGEEPMTLTDELGIAVCNEDLSKGKTLVREGDLEVTMNGWEHRPVHFHMYFMKTDDDRAPSRKQKESKEGKRGNDDEATANKRSKLKEGH